MAAEQKKHAEELAKKQFNERNVALVNATIKFMNENPVRMVEEGRCPVMVELTDGSVEPCSVTFVVVAGSRTCAAHTFKPKDTYVVSRTCLSALRRPSFRLTLRVCVCCVGTFYVSSLHTAPVSG